MTPAVAAPAPIRVLILEDRAEDAELVVGCLKAEGFSPAATVVETESEFREALRQPFDVIVVDYSLPAFDGLSAIRMVCTYPGPQPPVVVVTGSATEGEAVMCMRAGADDYLLKDRPARLGQAVRQAIERRSLKERSQDVEHELRLSERQLNVAQRIARMGSWEYHFASAKLTLSDGFREVFDLRDPSVVDLDAFMSRIHPDDRPRVRSAIERGARGDAAPETEYRIVLSDGRERTILARGELAREGDVLVAMRGTAQDVTARRQAEQQRHQSEQLFRQGFENAPIGMGVIDPEHRCFTRVNDAMCAITGQSRAWLQTPGSLTEITKPADRAADDAVFAQLVSGELKSDERHKSFRRPDGSLGWISRNLSVLRDPNGAVTGIFSQVIDITEQKRREQKLTDQVSEVSWIARIREALDHDRFVLHAQPIIDLASGELILHELLLRMKDDAGNLVYPGDFLPTAEKYGLITEIDQWVVRQGAALAAAGEPVALNLSGASIGNLHLLNAIEGALAASSASADDLVFEITETALMENLDRGELFAQKLVDLGCQFALDDFGTGFGSFTYLKRLHADYLKIDMEFIRELPRSERDQHVVRAIVTLAEGFGQQTIAEGVEDEETLQLLRELGVSHAQGYHIGRPAPMSDSAAKAPAVSQAGAFPQGGNGHIPQQSPGQPSPGSTSVESSAKASATTTASEDLCRH